MITANLYTKVEFDEEGRKRIKDAIDVIYEIYDAIRKCGCGDDNYIETLLDAAHALEDIELGKTLI